MSVATWKARATALKQETYALYFACRDSRVPWHAKLLAAVVVAYALSPIDLIPDFIPVIGYLDDILLIPLGVIAVRAMIPENVLAECRERAARLPSKPQSWAGAAVIAAIWIALSVAATYGLYRYFAG